MASSGHAPLNPQLNLSLRQTPRWDDIPVMNFTPHDTSPISPINVSYAIEVPRACFRSFFSHTSCLQALSATFDCKPAMRHLVIVATVNPSAEALGPRGNLAWSATAERLHRVGKCKVTCNCSHCPLYSGRDSGAPDRSVSG